MLNNQRAITNGDQDHHDDQVRDIHPLTPPPPPPPPASRGRHRESWETSSEGGLSENFTTMSREFNALLLAGSAVDNSSGGGDNLGRIGEEETMEETNPLAIVPDTSGALDPVASPRRTSNTVGASSTMINNHVEEVTLQRVKKEEIESKISAWQNAKIAKINNRFKREDAVLNGWEEEQVQKSTSWMKKVERKLEEKRARALEKMQNEVAKAHRKAEERRASSEAKRGTKVAKVLELANLMRAVGRPPIKRSFF